MTESQKKPDIGAPNFFEQVEDFMQVPKCVHVLQYNSSVLGVFRDGDVAATKREEVVANPKLIMEPLGLEQFFPDELRLSEYQLL